jgi:hypothetical protein
MRIMPFALILFLLTFAAWLLAGTPPMGPEIQISPTNYLPASDDFEPAVAYNSTHGEFLVAWRSRWGTSDTDYSDIWARRVDAYTGQLRGYFYVSRDGGLQLSRYQPAVAYNAQRDEYLVVWTEDPSDHTQYEIHGRTVSWDGTRGADTHIWSWGNRAYWGASVVWNSKLNEYLVTWSGIDTESGQANDVAGIRLTSTGTPIAGSTLIIEQDPVLRPSAVNVAYNANADEYLAVWQHWVAADNVFNIYARRIRPDGSFVGIGYPVDHNTDDQEHPRVAAGFSRYLLTWESHANWYGYPTADRRFRYFDNEGIPIGDVWGTWGADYIYRPALASIDNSDQFLAAYEVTIYPSANVGILGDLAGSTPGGIHGGSYTFSATPYWDCRWAAAAGGGIRFLLTYESWSSTFGQRRRIWGRVIKTTNQTFLPLLQKG